MSSHFQFKLFASLESSRGLITVSVFSAFADFIEMKRMVNDLRIIESIDCRHLKAYIDFWQLESQHRIIDARTSTDERQVIKKALPYLIYVYLYTVLHFRGLPELNFGAERMSEFYLKSAVILT